MDIDVDHIRTFGAPAEFGDWLSRYHARETEVWIQIYRRSSGATSVTWAESVVEAIAWGWIDGIKKALDDTSWLQRFTPRKPRSNWSMINRSHAERLIVTSRMQPAGLREVQSAKADGRWDRAYSGSADMVFPEAFLLQIADIPIAKEAFASLGRADLFLFFHRLQTVTKEATRQRLMTEMIKRLSGGALPF